MKSRAHLLGAALLAFLASLLLAAPARAGAPATRTLTNVATISWDAGGQQVELPSNRVDIDVVPPPSAAVLDTLRLTDTQFPPALLAGTCSAAAARAPSGAPQGPAPQPLASLGMVSTSELQAGRPIILALDRASSNLDSQAIETITVTVETDQGDREQILLIETAADSGRFIGIMLTTTGPPASGDCRFSVQTDHALVLTLSDTPGGPTVAEKSVAILIDPFGIAFDSRDGRPVSEVRITLVDAATGLPAQVFGDDGISSYPSTVVTGQSVTDSGGMRYDYPAGDYRFPLVRPGRYRLVVEPVSPYVAPSSATAADLAGLRRPDGLPFTIVAGSYGGEILLAGTGAVRIDIPLDRPVTPIVLSKTASRPEAEAGDLVRYRLVVRNPDPLAGTGELRISDRIPHQMRFRTKSARLDGVNVPDPVSGADGVLTFTLPSIAAGGQAVLTYVLEVRPDARRGDALNRAQAAGPRGNVSNFADALVRIRREAILDRMTITGRIVDGGCGVDPRTRPGIGGVRVMLEDGSYAVTDSNGLYHFEGVMPGTHVVQLDDATLPADRAAVDCSRNVRSGGRAFSRFVSGQGGALMRVDFHADAVAPRATAARRTAIRPAPAADAAAAGAERDWLTGQEPGLAWLFPTVDHNPRAPVVRVAIKHLPGQSVRLLNGGRPVDPIAFEGTRVNEAGTVAVSLWRGIPIEDRTTRLTAEIRDANGAVVTILSRPVTFSNVAVRAELIRSRSLLVADGVTRPVLALRLTDSNGRPVHHGLAGDFEVPAPYYPAVEADAQQARQLAGLERARPVWHVEGEDGIAYVELEPTTASGTVTLRFAFRDGELVREQRVEAWLDPGERPWTIVGLAEGTIGFNRLDRNLEALSGESDDVVVDGRLALYARGRISGRWLMTLAYDSDRRESETRFGGVIDPTAYYTVYADRSERRYEAASVRRLYLRLERPQFYALFGDYDTGIDEPELARYVRSMNGLKAEYRSDRVSATAFASDTPNRHRRDEIQGNGLTGPYALRSRNLIANSERVTLEIRDRLHSERIVESRLLTRHIDYDIDYAAGTLRFREPILSRSASLDPQFIVADYEVDGVAARELNAGARVAWRSADQRLQVAATAIHDNDGTSRTNLGGIDVRFRPTPRTEIRAEVAVSDTRATGGGGGGNAPVQGGTATAWQVEVEHHDRRFDILAYAREREGGFGVGQLNASENGTRKIGIDGRARITDTLSLTGGAWTEEYLNSDARRIAGRALIEYRGRDFSARAGLTIADDRLADGREARSQILQVGATRRFFNNRLELDAQSELPIGGRDDSIDFPARHRLSARFAVSRSVALIGSYEIADGAKIDARTARLGFELAPWAGARIALTGNVQDIAEYGPRSFAAFGLSQSLVLSERWSVDFTVDGNRTLGGVDPARVLNPLHPVASGGFVGDGATLTEDFTAITAGATYRAGRWSLTGRAEYRAGDREDRYGATFAALRQIGEGRAVGGALNWFTAEAPGGARTRTANLQLTWAHRPTGSAFSFLDKFELREDMVRGAVAGVPGPVGSPFTITGDARSRRIVNSLAVNYSPYGGEDRYFGRTELSLFWGTRYVSERVSGDDIKGWSNVVGADIRFDLNNIVQVGAAGTVRQGVGGRSYSFSGGPSVGIRPFENGWLTVGWNVVGFHDRDFQEDRYTRSGPYVTMRIKFDQFSLAGLGLGRRR
ncbi:MAG TPA: hypothetical protein VEX35_08415 [Allosphingosinicella sp.]|nr:hypothetical protein [Allosphingosinicella sp.]